MAVAGTSSAGQTLRVTASECRSGQKRRLRIAGGKYIPYGNGTEGEEFSKKSETRRRSEYGSVCSHRPYVSDRPYHDARHIVKSHSKCVLVLFTSRRSL